MTDEPGSPDEFIGKGAGLVATAVARALEGGASGRGRAPDGGDK